MPVCASAFVTRIVTVAGACAAVVPVMLVGVMLVTASIAPPNDAVAPAWKPVPVIVTEVPPNWRPLFGLTDVIAGGGGGVYVKQLVHDPVCASAFVTTTFTDPAACAVVVPVIEVVVMFVIARAEPPNDAVAPVLKPVPAIVTLVPPVDVPLFGDTEVIAGGGGGVN